MKTLVIFRMEADSPLAVFPYDPADHKGHEMGCYSHIGQHGGCSVEYYRTTKPAKPDQYAELKRELESAPYRYDFVVRQRIPSDAYRKRRESLKA